MVIEHVVTTTAPIQNEKSASATSSTSSCLFLLCKPTMKTSRAIGITASSYLIPVLGLYALFTTVSSSFLLDRFLTIPGLQSVEDELRAQVANLTSQVNLLEMEVDNLTTQVDLFTNEVDRLEENVDRYDVLNTYLKGNITELSIINHELNESVQSYSILNDELNTTVKEYESQNDVLIDELDRFEQLNANLSFTIDRLENEKDDLQQINENITSQVNQMDVLNQKLTVEVQRMEKINNNLTVSNNRLSDSISDLTNQTTIMKNEIDTLTSIVLFLNNTAENINQTFGDTITFLDTMIVKFQETVLTDTERYWETLMFNWRCDLDSAFRSENFTLNASIPIGNQSYHEVMEYLDERIFQKMCIDLNDMKQYILEYAGNQDLNESNITVGWLSSGIAFYYLEMEEHYFSFFEEDTGIFPGPLSMNEWEAAKYDCSNLPNHRIFQYYIE